jgi:hypothetical protein
MKTYDVTIFTIATGKYWSYFLRLLPELTQAVSADELQLICLTDSYPEDEFSRPGVELKVSPIQSLAWPEITLFRYEQILNNVKSISGAKLIWLDVDMEIVKAFNPHELFSDKVSLAQHPGYLKPESGSFSASLATYFRETLQWPRGLLGKSQELDPWENREESMAFVPESRRDTYFHGAIWGGPTDLVLTMCRNLALRTRDDYQRGVVAKWHDESHLNWWASNNYHRVLPRHFSGARGYPMNSPRETYLYSLDKSLLDLGRYRDLHEDSRKSKSFLEQFFGNQ